MLVYNLLSDLTATQILIFAAFEALFLVLSWVVFKIRPSIKVLMISILAACVLALLSGLIGYGFYGGMMYHERLGWPFPFQTISRNIEAGSLPGVPFAFRFDLLKFLATCVFWGILPAALLLNIYPNRGFRIFTGIFLVILIALTLIFCLNNARPTPESLTPEIPEAVVPNITTPDPKSVKIMREMIEETFPEFTDFENQSSFAGKSVKVGVEDGEYYFAYITHGSGLPIIKATCFRVDWQTAYKIGEYPNPFDSYRGHMDIDPQTCKGIQ